MFGLWLFKLPKFHSEGIYGLQKNRAILNNNRTVIIFLQLWRVQT